MRLVSLRLIFAAALIALGTASAVAQEQPRVDVRPLAAARAADVVLVIDGRVIEAESIHLAPRAQQVMVCLRDLEKLGWGAIQSAEQNQVVFSAKGVTLTFTKGQSLAQVNTLAVQLPIDTYVRGGRLMVPLSFVAKALGYSYEASSKVVAMVTTSPRKQETAGNNSLTGRVTYDGKGVQGIRVRAVDRNFWAVPGATATTDADGNYTLSGLPDGEYMAHVWIQDNPTYFNRASEPAVVVGGETAQVKPVALGRVLAPIAPRPGTSVSRASGGVDVAWSVCEGAEAYSLVIRKPGAQTPAVEISTTKPTAKAPAAKLTAGVEYEAEVTALSKSGEFLGGTAGSGGEAVEVHAQVIDSL